MSSHVVTLEMNAHGGRARRKAQFATLFERLACTERAQRLLHRMGLDPGQFVIFLRLFRTLSEREEFAGSVGVQRFNISYVALFAAGLGLFPWLVVTGSIAENDSLRIPGSGLLPESMFLLFLLFLTFAFTFLVIVREAATALFNPVEASMLAHSPIHSPTYAAAKIAHILIAVLYLVLGVNAYPALLEAMFLGLLSYPGARWFLPAAHLVSASLIGIWTAFIICAFYGLLRRIAPASLLKSLCVWIQMLPLCALAVLLIFYPRLIFESFLPWLLTSRFENSQWTWLPLTWFAEIGRLGCLGASWKLGGEGALTIIGSALFIAFGLRSFSGTYLLKAAAGIQGAAWRRHERSVLSRWCAAVMSTVTGSALGLAAFSFVSKMIRRDSVFRRCIFKQAWIPMIAIVGVVLGISRFGLSSIIPGGQSAALFLPHFLGVIALAFCINLPFTVFSKGAWIYLVAPIGSAREFARGIYWALWLPAAGLPHLAMVFFFMKFLGWEEAVFVAGFNLIVLSLYLAFEIRWIAQLPFCRQANESRSMISGVYIQICGFAAAGIPIIMHEALFERLWVAMIAALAAFIITVFVLRANLRRLEKEILWRLYVMRMGSNQMFREFE